MKNVEWVEVLPFHQLGAFKWKALGLDYPLAETPPAPPELVARVVGQFRDGRLPGAVGTDTNLYDETLRTPVDDDMSAKLPVAAVGAWLLVAVYYFYQYALRSAPSVMMPQLTEAFGVNALGVSAIVGMFYYGYSPFSLVAGAAIDRFGAKRIVPIGAALVGVGALLFGTGNVVAANIGRFLQGAGGVFALVGAVYLVTKNFPASCAASFIGATQMFGMAGGSAGQFCVGPLIKARSSLGAVLDLRRRLSGW